MRREPQLPRRRVLAALRPGGVRRDHLAQRVPHARLGHAGVRLRPEPGVVRVREPAGRARRHGLRRAARLHVGLRRGQRRADGREAHRPRPAARPGLDRPGAARGDPELLRASGGAEPRRGRSPSRTTRRPGEWISTTSATRSPTGPRPSTSRTRRSSASSSPTRRRSPRSRARRAPRRSSASTRSASACSRRPAAGARTSSSARRSRWACTCTAAAARAASSRHGTRSATRASTRRCRCRSATRSSRASGRSA